MITCSDEILTVTLRTHPDGGGFGDDYDLCVTVIGDEGVATIKGLTTAVSTAHRRAIFARLRQLEFHTVRWTRHKRGQVIERRYDLCQERPS